MICRLRLRLFTDDCLQVEWSHCHCDSFDDFLILSGKEEKRKGNISSQSFGFVKLKLKGGERYTDVMDPQLPPPEIRACFIGSVLATIVRSFDGGSWGRPHDYGEFS